MKDATLALRLTDFPTIPRIGQSPILNFDSADSCPAEPLEQLFDETYD
jgi:hypothetical protein